MTLQDIAQEAKKFTDSSPLNRVESLGIPSIFDAPLFGAADASDEIFDRYTSKDVIGVHHQKPVERMEGARSVVSYFLPFSETIRIPNRTAGLPAVEWVYGRIEGDQFNRALAAHLSAFLSGLGISVDVPMLDPEIRVTNLLSSWSERHAAYAAGIGSFGLSRSLISSRGCAGRYGSLITSLPLEPTPRIMEPFWAYCGTCGRCIQRCPAGAITSEGKHIPTCAAYLDTTISPMFSPRYGCGKCQTAVPCERALPGDAQRAH